MPIFLEAGEAHSGGTVFSTNIAVTARVLERTRLYMISQVPEFTVTRADIVRGYIAVTAATRVYVQSNNPAGFLLTFEVINEPEPWLNSVQVLAGGREVTLSSGNGWMPLPSIRGGITLDVSYRFVLSKHAHPGIYNWPLMISALPR